VKTLDLKSEHIFSVSKMMGRPVCFNPLNAELNPIRQLLALAGAHHFVHVSRIRVNDVTILVLHIVHLRGLNILLKTNQNRA
jgi:hypothetical protein